MPCALASGVAKHKKRPPATFIAFVLTGSLAGCGTIASRHERDPDWDTTIYGGVALDAEAIGQAFRGEGAGLMLMLVVFDVLEWKEVEAASGPSMEDALSARAMKMEAQNHFLALGVHWSSTSQEIDARHRALVDELAAPPGASTAVKDALARIRRRADAAYAVLREPGRRRQRELAGHLAAHDAGERVEHRADIRETDEPREAVGAARLGDAKERCALTGAQVQQQQLALGVEVPAVDALDVADHALTRGAQP